MAKQKRKIKINKELVGVVNTPDLIKNSLITGRPAMVIDQSGEYIQEHFYLIESRKEGVLIDDFVTVVELRNIIEDSLKRSSIIVLSIVNELQYSQLLINEFKSIALEKELKLFEM